MAAAVNTQPLLPPELLAHVFSQLPFNAQHMTVALLSKHWHAWALQQRGGAPTFSPQPSRPLPAHAVQHAWDSGVLLTTEHQGKRLLACAAGSGGPELLRWLRSQDPHCPWDASACVAAAEGGHLDVLQWLRSHDPPCPWDEGACAWAAEGGHMRVLQWLRSQDPPCPWGEGACAAAARGGHLGVLQWLRAQDPPCPWDEQVLQLARLARRQDVVQWAREHGAPK